MKHVPNLRWWIAWAIVFFSRALFGHQFRAFVPILAVVRKIEPVARFVPGGAAATVSP